MNTQSAIETIQKRLENGIFAGTAPVPGKVLEHETIKGEGGFQCDLILVSLPDKTFNVVAIVVYENRRHYPQISMDMANFKDREAAETLFLEVSLAHGFLRFGANIKINKSGVSITGREEFAKD